MASKKKFLKEVFVHQEDMYSESIDQGFSRLEDLADSYDISINGDTAIVAVYKLDRVVKVTRQSRLVETKISK